ncbi:MAG: hypothetical protein UX77_C0021G0010 [Parcubacteria group bacterium GW2011_GWA1_47_11]|nr:MAG: hypothetical protein UX77_C0021G0010 [Parcubacteria group bacterium GW2011_GWA1_47_11]
MKKVLIFSLAYYPRVGGAEVAIKEITDRLGSEYSFDLITALFDRALPRKEQIGAVMVHRLGVGIPLFDKLWLPWGGALYARKLHKQNGYGVWWCMMATFGSGAAYIAKIIRWGGLIGLSWWLALRRTQMLTVISSYLAERAKVYGYKGSLEIIPNGVDVQKFSGAPVAHGGVVLIHTGRLVHKNAVDDIICALKLLPQEVRLRLFGIGPDFPKLCALAKKLGVEARVEFMGFVDQAQLPALLHAADIFIRPSRSEGMGNSFIEAFAAGLPVIATQKGGLKDYITSEVAWPVEKDSPLQIAAAVEAIVRNPQATGRVVENAKQLAARKYDWNLLARAMREKVFARLFHT